MGHSPLKFSCVLGKHGRRRVEQIIQVPRCRSLRRNVSNRMITVQLSAAFDGLLSSPKASGANRHPQSHCVLPVGRLQT